jgi:DNA-binding LytR/AlgR family response regulator
MVPLVARWLGRFPLRRADWSRSIPAHLLGSLLFTAGHYAAMVAQRIVVFRLAGMEYLYRHDPLGNLAFEYTKDVKIYLGILLVIALYRRLRRGESAAAPASAPAETPNRLLVQTGAGERLLELSEIDYLQAARNYVSVHAGGREYLVRDTIASLSSRLAASGFLRSHRSYLVNAARIDEVRPAADGAWELRLRGGSRVPLSRSYRDAVRERIRNAAST